MIYFLVTVQVQRRKMKEWTKLYEKHILPATTRHGQRLVGAWKTTVGTYDEVTDLYAFENLKEFERIRKTLSNDLEIKKFLPVINAITGYENIKNYGTSSILRNEVSLQRRRLKN